MVALWLIAGAVGSVVILRDIDFLFSSLSKPNLKGVDTARLVSDTNWISVAPFIGLPMCLIVLLIIAKKRHWFWLNPLLSFLFAYLFIRFVNRWNPSFFFFYLLGGKMNVYFVFGLSGLLMLSLGLVLLFSTRVLKFIEAGAAAQNGRHGDIGISEIADGQNPANAAKS